MIFLPTQVEQKRINAIQKVYNRDYALIRLTTTMLNKSIIDASFIIRNLFKKNNIVDYEYIKQGTENKILKTSLLISGSKDIKIKTSFYRPNTKKGDPRFWLSKFKSIANANDLIYLTVFEETLVVILLDENFNINYIKSKFADSKIQLKSEILNKINLIREKGFVYSVSESEKMSARDVGDTFEREMGIEPNSSPAADYKGQVELKAKRINSRTKDSLFSQVPYWKDSLMKSTSDIVLKYGYPHNELPDFASLYVTVSNLPNKQGLYLKIEEEEELLTMCDNTNTRVCVWRFKDIEKKLLNKHPSTLWILAEEKLENNQNRWQFKYTDAILTRNPIFVSFLNLIKEGKITYDWRAKVKLDGTASRDHGNGFRLNPNYRGILFAEEEIL